MKTEFKNGFQLPTTLSNLIGKLRLNLIFCLEKNNMNQKSMQIPLTQNTEKKIPSVWSGDDEPKAQNNNSVCSFFKKLTLTVAIGQ